MSRLKISAQLVVTLCAVIYVISLLDFSQLRLAWLDTSTESLIWVWLLLSCNIFVTAIRFQAVLSGLGYNIPFRHVFKTHIISQIAGAVFFQLVGHTASRATLLFPWGVDAAAAFVVSAVERVIAAFAALGLCMIGAMFLFGGLSPAGGVGPNYLVKCLTVLGLACVFVMRYSGRDYFNWLKINVLKLIAIRQLLLAALITLVGQLLVGLSYVVIANNLADGAIPLTKLLSASFIITFAATIPISFAGWGMRELGAVWVLGAIGMPEAQAALVAVLIGVLSIILLVVPLPLVMLFRRRMLTEDGNNFDRQPQRAIEYRNAVFLGLPLACGVLIFFQLHLPVIGGIVNVNLADPVAVAAGLLGGWELARRKMWPAWQVPRLNTILIVISCVFIVSLFIGISRFGLTPWAFNNRFTGWFILMAYLLAGGLAGGIGGVGHRESVLRAVVVTGVVVALCEWGLLFLKIGGVIPAGTGWIGQNLEGLVLDRNAFAFQMLAVLSMLFIVNKGKLRIVNLAMTAVVITITILTWSRAGWLALPVVLVIAWRRGMLDLRNGAVIAGLSSLMVFAPFGASQLMEFFGVSGGTVQVLLGSGAQSNLEHLQTVFFGIKMWLDHPLMGAGLGAFIKEWQITHGSPKVIHNIYVWMLAETGVVGFGSFFCLMLAVVSPIFKRKKGFEYTYSEQTGLLLLMACMIVVGTFHDMLYQRIFWFLAGLLLMKPLSLGNPTLNAPEGVSQKTLQGRSM